MAQDPLSHVASWIAPATTEPAPDDNKILSLFQQWAAAEKAALTQRSGDQFEAACDHMDNIVDKIADTPAAGVSGLAIKIHLRNGIGFDHLTTRLEASILKDTNRFVLDLAPGRCVSP